MRSAFTMAGDAELQMAPHEIARSLLFRVSKDVLRWTFLVNAALVKKNHPICNMIGKTKFVGHYQHREAPFSKTAHGLENFSDQFWVKC